MGREEGSDADSQGKVYVMNASGLEFGLNVHGSTLKPKP